MFKLISRLKSLLRMNLTKVICNGRKQKKAVSRLQFRPHRRQNSDSHKRKVICILVLLLLSIEVLEFPTYISYLRPSILINQSDWFLLKSYHLNVYEYYYFKWSAERVAWILRMWAFTMMAAWSSTVLFLGSFIILCHLFFDLFLLWICNNTWPLAHEFEILFICITFRGLVRPYSPDSFARIRSIF